MQKSDSCKRFCTGVLLSLFVIGVMFGCACVFLTNQYKHSGLQQFPDKFSDSLEDADTFLRRTQNNTGILLVDNFLILERRVLKDLEEGGSTIKAGQAERMGAGARGPGQPHQHRRRPGEGEEEADGHERRHH